MKTNQRSTETDPVVKEAMAYIESHSEEKFSLQAISGALFINGSYLLRRFKEQTGMTLLAYHNKTRCDKAKVLLANESMTISEVGEAVGFVSSSHFAHIFKKTVGMTPTAYKSLIREREEA